MWAEVIEFLPEVVETALLSRHASSGRTSCLLLQGFMHAFVAAVLLGLAGLDELGEDSQPNPPGGEGGEA